MYSGDETGGLVCDYGSHTTKVGFAGEDCPRIVRRTTFNFEQEFTQGINELLCGTNKDDHPVVVTMPPLLTLKDRVEWTEIILEKNTFPATFLLRSPVASAFASGKSTCVAVEVGASALTICPVFEGYCLLKCLRRSEMLGGESLTKLISKKYSKQFPLPKDKNLFPRYWDTLEDVKHTHFKVWKDGDYQVEKAPKLGTLSYRLPDGEIIQIEEERFEICESLFDSSDGAGALLYSAIAQTEPDLRKHFSQEILVIGGGSLLTNFPERLGIDISKRLPLSFKPRVLSPGSTIERRFAPFVGGSVLASLGSFQQLWLSKKEWSEMGEKGVTERFIQ